MDIKPKLLERARGLQKRIVFPEGDDPRVLAAAYRWRELECGQPILLGEPAKIDAVRRELGLPEPDFTVLPIGADRERFIARFLEIRKKKGATLTQAESACADPLFVAAMMVRGGEADACVGGAVRTTADTVRAAIQMIGPREKTVSSFFLMIMENPERSLLFADCGVIPLPTAPQLAEIAMASAISWRLLTGLEPSVAMLSFSTLGSASDPSIDRIHQALAMVREREQDLAIDGELQADAALIPEVGKRKALGSRVAGKANILIFPNLHAGNIAYKLTERLASATALGPILQGLRKPMNDLSRGCSSDDVFLVAAISAIQCGD